ncbi:KilA-N domain-containing protein [Bacteroides sp.]|uniref:KilA-N domain-containing protein n=1 Tax=Bacteroides sp. TaxID=29523 RepID=UPI0025BA4BA3|nr:KilA-N domain-containing protein [Bacteroides sp.]
METKICIFKENPITFALDKNNGMMVNATEMAKAFEKDLYQFTKSEDTKRFIEACQKPANAGLLGIVNESDLIVSRQKSGTYMHRVLALKFASWLNPDFELWVYSTIERILFGKHAQREESLERSLNYQTESKKLRDKPNKTGVDFERYLELDKELKREKAIRKSLTAEAVTEMKSLFEEDEE